MRKLRIQLKLNTALLSTVRVFVRSSVTGVTSHISHIYKGINAMLIIRGPIKPYIFWIKIILAIFLAKTRPHKTIFFALTNLTIDFDFLHDWLWIIKYINAESAVFTLSCLTFWYFVRNMEVMDWRFIDTAIDNFLLVRIEHLRAHQYSFQLQSVLVVAMDGISSWLGDAGGPVDNCAWWWWVMELFVNLFSWGWWN